MEEMFFQKREDGSFLPHTDEDKTKAANYKTHQIIRSQTYGIKKARAYKELCAYKGSCKYIASLNLDANKDSESKVDMLTKIHCGFVSGTLYDEKTGQVHWMVESLGYANCDQPGAHRFIKAALEEHAYLAGVDSVEAYVAHLKHL